MPISIATKLILKKKTIPSPQVTNPNLAKMPINIATKLTLKKKIAPNLKVINPNLVKLPTNTYTYLPLIPDMDTSSGSARKSIRASLTAQYDERVASTLEKVDPNRAKARSMLKEDTMVTESLDGEWEGYADPLPEVKDDYNDAPLLTLRELMPGATGGDDEDYELDLTFRANKVEFIVTHRPLHPEEIKENSVLKDPADVDWSIPDQVKFEDIMGNCLDIYTDERPELVHALSWSSVGATTGVGCFSIRTGRMADMDDIRGTLRTIVVGGKCFESFPKKALMESYSLTAFFPRATKCVGTKKLVTWLLSCNRGLQGKIWPVEARKYPDDHPIIRRRGARVLSFTGDQKFLDSLQRFPKNFPFNIRIANVYIRGGERTKEGQTVLRRRRPRMTAEALKNLLQRHGKEILEEEEAEDNAKRTN